MIAATNRNLELAVHEHKFRSDLYYRLNVATITLPALRERSEDIPDLVQYFLARHGAEFGTSAPYITPEAILFLQQQPWPGNITQLEHVITLSLFRSRGFAITAETVQAALVESIHAGVSQAQPVVSDYTESTERRSPEIPDYHLVREIGRGAYGSVWLARTITGGYRAAKLIYRKNLPDTGAFEQEFFALKRIESMTQDFDGLVRILHVGRNDESGYYYYIMELGDAQSPQWLVRPESYAAKTLSSEIHRRGMLPVKECLQIGISLATTLHNLHTQNLVHRDLKPSNIIFVNGRSKLADIGLVTDAGGHSYRGTPGYIPPEGPGKPSADVYSLGKVIYEMMTGLDRLKFSEIRGSPAPEMLRMLPILRKACDDYRANRYESAEAFREALAALQAELAL